MNNEELLAFSLIEGIGEKTLKRLNYFSDADEVIMTSDEDLSDVITNEKLLYEIKNNFGRYIKKADGVKRRVDELGGKIISKNSPEYPERLSGFDKSPCFLYCVGNIKLLNSFSTAAISGPRNIGAVGSEKAYNTARSLASEETVIISGLALGVDTEAHKAAARFGRTVAVLPFFQPVYPPENKRLCTEILENGGLIIAEYFAQFNIKFQLLNRDKIIVGLADSLYAPCAFRTDSGTSFTVNYALAQNKTVYVNNKGIFVKYTGQ